MSANGTTEVEEAYFSLNVQLLHYLQEDDLREALATAQRIEALVADSNNVSEKQKFSAETTPYKQVLRLKDAILQKAEEEQNEAAEGEAAAPEALHKNDDNDDNNSSSSSSSSSSSNNSDSDREAEDHRYPNEPVYDSHTNVQKELEALVSQLPPRPQPNPHLKKPKNAHVNVSTSAAATSKKDAVAAGAGGAGDGGEGEDDLTEEERKVFAELEEQISEKMMERLAIIRKDR